MVRNDFLTGNNFDVVRADFDGRHCDVIGRDGSISGRVNGIGEVSMQTLAGGKERGFARAKLLSLDFAGFEIVADLVADPDLLVALRSEERRVGKECGS